MGLPCDRRRVVSAGLSTAALVVEDQLMLVGKLEHLWQQVLMIGTGTAVKDEQAPRAGRTVGAPVQWNRRGGGEAGRARWWNGRHVAWKVVGGKLACEGCG